MKRIIIYSATAALIIMLTTAATVPTRPAPDPQNADMISTAEPGKRVGMIGLDTSHAPAFARTLNARLAPAEDYRGFRVVAAFPQGSRDIESSTSRVPGYIQDLREMNVAIVDSIPALLKQVDFVLLESNDGRVHLEQALPVIEAGKPLFIDKPMAASLADVIAIFEAARAKGVPVFSASSLRWVPGALELRGGAQGMIKGVDAFSWASLEPTHPDLYWYGIHGVEILYTVMGTGCRTVSRFQTEDTEFCVGLWEGGRIGTFRGLRSSEHSYGGTVFAEKKIEYLPMIQSYDPMVKAIAQFFDTGRPPVSRDETIEIYAFMSAADRSKTQNGRPVLVADVLAEARAEARALLERLHMIASQAYVPPTRFAWIHLALGDIDSAFAWIDRAIDARDTMMIPIKTCPFLDLLRADPPFLALLRKMNLEP